MSNLEFSQLKQRIKLKEKGFKFTENQINFLQTALDPETILMLLAGPSGTSKSYMAIYAAIQLMIKSDMEKSILYIRSIAESGQKSIGALPGNVQEKFNSFAGPLHDKLDEIVDTQDIKYLWEKKFVETMPVNFLRGASWTDKIVIADEAQNFSKGELMTILTRIGKNSKLIICGDMMQSDIANGAFSEIYDIFNDSQSQENGVNCLSFDNEDIKRSEILKFIIAKIENHND